MAGRLSKVLKQRIFFIAFVESKQIKRLSAQVKSLVALICSAVFLIAFSIVSGIVCFQLLENNRSQALYIEELKASLLQYTIQENPAPKHDFASKHDSAPNLPTEDSPSKVLPSKNLPSSGNFETGASDPQGPSLDTTQAPTAPSSTETPIPQGHTLLGLKIIDIVAAQSTKPNQTRIQFTLQRVSASNISRKGAMLGTVCLAAFRKGRSEGLPDWLSPHTSTHSVSEGSPPCDGGVSVKFNHLRPIDLPIPTGIEELGSVSLVFKDNATGQFIVEHHQISE